MRAAPCWIGALGVLVTAAAQAQRAPARPDSLTPDRALDVWRPSDLQFSPDGRQLAFVVSEPPDSSGTPRHIWTLDAASLAIRRLTSSPRSEWSPRWSPDGRWLAFISNRSDGSHLYVMPADSGAARAITGGKLAPSSIAWSPDGNRIAFLARDTAQTADPLVADRSDQHTRLWLVEVITGNLQPLTPADWEVAELAWTPSGTSLVIAATDRPASDSLTARIWRLDLATDSLLPVAMPSGYFNDLRVSPDGRNLSFIGCRVDGPWPHDLTVLPLEGGAPRNLTGATLDRAILQYAWLPHGSVAVLLADGFGTRLVRLDSLNARLVTLPTRGTLDAFGVSPSGTLAFVAESATAPPELYLARRPENAVAVSRFNRAWEDIALAAPRRFTYRSAGGERIEAELLLPAGPAGARLPLVTLVHGGPTDRWSDAVDALGQLLVRRGMAVFYPNVRGSVGYGERFIELVRGDWGGALKDVMIGIDTLIGRGLVDSTRLGIGGWSYGGYLSAWAITQTGRFRAAVVGGGIADLVSEIGTEYASWYDEWFNGWPADHPNRFLGQSPVNFASAVHTPTLILHGANDAIDPLGQARELYRSLKHYGVPVELVVYPRESHHIAERHHLRDRLTRTLDWFERWVKMP